MYWLDYSKITPVLFFNAVLCNSFAVRLSIRLELPAQTHPDSLLLHPNKDIIPCEITADSTHCLPVWLQWEKRRKKITIANPLPSTWVLPVSLTSAFWSASEPELPPPPQQVLSSLPAPLQHEPCLPVCVLDKLLTSAFTYL